MKCVNHPSVDSVAFCGQCGRPLCGACRHEVRGMAYCENCLAVRLQSPGLPPILGPGAGPSPGAALALGFIPGSGRSLQRPSGEGHCPGADLHSLIHGGWRGHVGRFWFCGGGVLFTW